jgi:hypothetical protein
VGSRHLAGKLVVLSGGWAGGSLGESFMVFRLEVKLVTYLQR